MKRNYVGGSRDKMGYCDKTGHAFYYCRRKFILW